jgi:hypothetical protein
MCSAFATLLPSSNVIRFEGGLPMWWWAVWQWRCWSWQHCIQCGWPMSRFSLPQGLLCNLHLGGVLEYRGLSMSVNQQLAVAHDSVMDCITDPNVPSNLLYPQIWVSTFLISHVSPWSFSRPNMRRVIKKKSKGALQLSFWRLKTLAQRRWKACTSF